MKILFIVNMTKGSVPASLARRTRTRDKIAVGGYWAWINGGVYLQTLS